MSESDDLKQRIEALKKKLNPDQIRQEKRQLEANSAKKEFWQDQEKATEEMKRLAWLEKELNNFQELDDLISQGEIQAAEKKLAEFELRVFMGGKYDRLSALVSVHAGQGGVEAMDWAQMLQRMFLRYFEKKGWKAKVLAENFGEEAGIKSVTIAVNEPYAYGYLKFEAGTHRLVRQSPFNADNLRQTSFALVEVLPQIENEAEAEIKDEDIEWQFYRASTQGGQNVQKVSTAVRLTHRPTGIVVTCEQERTQEQNRKIARQLLQGKLWQRKQERQQKEIKSLKKGRTMAAWGTQIRSYVLHPYKMVKDLRTKFETQDAESVLDGELDEFIQVEIRRLSMV